MPRLTSQLTHRFRRVPHNLVFGVALVCMTANTAVAQDIYLPAGADPILRGDAGGRAGSAIEQGSVAGGDTRRDLIIGEPGWSASAGRVTVLISGTPPSGTVDLTTAAQIKINGATSGDLFGAALATGNVFSNSTTLPNAQRDLVVAAPGSTSSATGRVYVFPGPITTGTHPLTDARFVLQGTTGDGFGQTVATADLNHDGYREVIVGAPAGNRVYVFNLLSRTPGVLSAATADMVIVADAEVIDSGLGEVVDAGIDITGDGVHDLALGLPRAYGSRGTVLVVRGRVGWAFPGAGSPVNAVALSSLRLIGVDPGDRAGQSVAFKDIVETDTNGVRDLIVGAPGADGLDNGRPNSGEVYVLWGGTLAGPSGCDIYTTTIPCDRYSNGVDVVMYGAAAGYATGERVTGGDINRDNPDDLVLTAPGGPSGIELQVVYGTRLRQTFGAVVDLNTPDKIDRRVIGAAVTVVRVFEATGEGANDIIAGAPSLDSERGLVYFAVSPKLTLSTQTMTMTGVQCATPSQAIEVRNSSVVPLTWNVQANVAWLEASVSNGTSLLGSPVSARIVARTAGLMPGSYSGTIDVVSTSKHVSMFRRITVSLTVQAASPRLSTATSDFSGDGCGDVVTFTAATGVWKVPGRADVQLGLVGDRPVAGDYNGDRIAEPAVYRPSNSTWYFGSSQLQFGTVGDVPVPADYDGDGDTDIAVYRPSSGVWLIYGQSSVTWGGPGQLPVPGDYDGNGVADIAVYHRGSGEWRIRNQGTTQFGLPVDVPVQGDFNGDGTTDIAVYRRTSGVWYVRNQFSMQWGLPGDIPAVVDTNRDGQAELLVYRRATAIWYSADRISGLVQAISSGTPGDMPAISGIAWLDGAKTDFDGDSKSDLVVYRPSQGGWYIRYSSQGYAAGAAAYAQWGLPGDLPLATDFSGDSRADLTVFRPRTATWFAGGVGEFQWGLTGDTPVGGDLDGDFRTDLTVFRPADGGWYVRKSSEAYSVGTANFFQWGLNGDIPLSADFDSDGAMDLTVFRPASGDWFVRYSSGTSLSGAPFTTSARYQWGLNGDVPLSGDFDGDGTTDLTVWRPATGQWFIRYSSQGFNIGTSATFQWGLRGDEPLVGDFDGDGKAELTVFRPSTGEWYMLRSSTNYTARVVYQWGVAGDTPIAR